MVVLNIAEQHRYYSSVLGVSHYADIGPGGNRGKGHARSSVDERGAWTAVGALPALPAPVVGLDEEDEEDEEENENGEGAEGGAGLGSVPREDEWVVFDLAEGSADGDAARTIAGILLQHAPPDEHAAAHNLAHASRSAAGCQ